MENALHGQQPRVLSMEWIRLLLGEILELEVAKAKILGVKNFLLKHLQILTFFGCLLFCNLLLLIIWRTVPYRDGLGHDCLFFCTPKAAYAFYLYQSYMLHKMTYPPYRAEFGGDPVLESEFNRFWLFVIGVLFCIFGVTMLFLARAISCIQPSFRDIPPGTE